MEKARFIPEFNVDFHVSRRNTEVKGVDFSNPGHLKLCLLSQGIQSPDPQLFTGLMFAENNFPYGYSNDVVRELGISPSELRVEDGKNEIAIGLHFRDDSPWTLSTTDGNQLKLSCDGVKIADVGFNPKPRFFGETLSNGQPAEKVAVMYGLHALSFFTRGWCYYFVKDIACGFCSLNPTREELGKGNVKNTAPKIAKEAAELAFSLDGDRIFYVNHCAGTHVDNDLGLTHQMDVLKAVMEVTPPGVKHHMLTMPPDTLSLIGDLKKSGLGTLNFAIEIFDPDLFREICPGKDQLYGYDKFMEAYKAGVQAFGSGNMYANFVGGLEPVESMEEGFEYFARQGIVPSVNVFHPDPKSRLADRKPPSVDYLIRVAKAQSKIYSDYGLSSIYPRGGSRNSLDNEVYKGYFK